LVCKRHVEDIDQMTTAEFQELLAIKKSILEGGSYNQIVENSVPRRTVRPHYHLHLLNF
jgi:diadenosine tetraphosphate (Ap4A) HIT family hydrolase